MTLVLTWHSTAWMAATLVWLVLCVLALRAKSLHDADPRSAMAVGLACFVTLADRFAKIFLLVSATFLYVLFWVVYLLCTR